VAITPDQQAEIAAILCQLLLESEDPRIRARSAQALGKLGIVTTIPALCQAASTDVDVHVRLNAIDALVFIAKPEFVTTMADSAKNQPSFQINQVGTLNTGDVTIRADQVGIQYNYTLSSELQAALSELRSALDEIQSRHPEIISETQALAIIDAEFTEIQ
jgi:hypothetical protein